MPLYFCGFDINDIDPNNIRKFSSDKKEVIELEIDMINVKVIKF